LTPSPSCDTFEYGIPYSLFAFLELPA
jgi:hypothetical protein